MPFLPWLNLNLMKLFNNILKEKNNCNINAAKTSQV